MKTDIHPEVFSVKAHCACGNDYETESTMADLRTTLCSACHPFYTNKQKFLDTANRIKKFEQKYNIKK